MVVNPKAGTLQSRRNFFTMVNFFCERDFLVNVHITQRKGDATEVVSQSEGMYDIIACAGGDGTLNEVIAGIMKLKDKPLLGYIPCGSTNDFAYSLNLPKNMLRSAEIIAQGQAHPLDVGSFCGRHFAYVASFGSFSDSSFSAPQNSKNALGHFAYILEGIMDLPNFKPLHVIATSDAGIYEDDFLFGCISNTLSMGGILRFDKMDIALDDGLFEVMLIKTPKKPGDLQKIINCLTRQKFDCDLIASFKTNRIELNMADRAPWSLDGEYQEGLEDICVENLHSAINILR